MNNYNLNTTNPRTQNCWQRYSTITNGLESVHTKQFSIFCWYNQDISISAHLLRACAKTITIVKPQEQMQYTRSEIKCISNSTLSKLQTKHRFLQSVTSSLAVSSPFAPSMSSLRSKKKKVNCISVIKCSVTFGYSRQFPYTNKTTCY